MSVFAVSELIRHGRARRATVILADEPLHFENLGVWLNPEEGLAHLLDAEMTQHLATVPLDSIVVEWADLSQIRRVPHVSG